MRKRITLCTVLLALVLATGCSSAESEQSKENIAGNTVSKENEEKPNLTMAPEGGCYVNETEESPKESPEEPEPTEVPVNLVSVPVRVYGGVESLKYEMNDYGCVSISGVDENVTHLYIPAKIDGIPVSDVEIFHSAVKEVVLDESMPRDVAVEFKECFELERLYLSEWMRCSWLTNCPNAVYHVREKSMAEKSKISEKEWDPDVKWAYYGEVPEWVEYVKYQSGTVEVPEVTLEAIEFDPGSISVASAEVFDYYVETWENRVVIHGLKDETIEHLSIPAEIEGYPVVEISKEMFSNVNCFEGNTKLKSLVIPETVTHIDEAAFKNCEKLEYVVISGKLETLSPNMFDGCKSLKYVSLPDGLREIGKYAFNDCCRLTSITIPDSVEKIGAGAFWGCSWLTELVFPNAVTEIAAATCRECVSLEKVTLPENLSSIGTHAFMGCNSLESFEVPEGIKVLDDVFSNCATMSHCVLPASLETINANEFGGSYALVDIMAPEGSYAANWAREKGFRVNAKPEEAENGKDMVEIPEEWRNVEAIESITYKDVVLSEKDFKNTEHYALCSEMGLQEFSMKMGEGEEYTYSVKVSGWMFGGTPGDYMNVYSGNRYEMKQVDFGHYYGAEILDYDTYYVLKIIVSYPQALSAEKKAEFIDTVSESILKNLEK